MAGQGEDRPQRGHGPSPARGRRPSSKVYRRRRFLLAGLVVLMVAFLVAAVIVLGINLLSGGGSPSTDAAATASASTNGAEPTTTATPTPSASSTPTPTASSTATPSAGSTRTPSPSASSTASATSSAASAPTCSVDALTVTGSTDSQSYPAGKNPLLTLKVTNSSKAACSVNVGTNQMEFQIFRGNERVFSSRDCQEGGEDLVRTLAPGASETANFRWLRNRTAPGCSPVSDVPPPGSYSYQVSLGQSTSNKTTFGLE